MKLKSSHQIVLFLSFLMTFQLSADNWPQWRGAKLDSISSESGLPSELSKKTMLWRMELPGSGGASPIVWEDQVFVTTVAGEGGDELWLLCASTEGRLKWKQQLEGSNQKVRDNGNSASPSPVTDGQHVWVMMTNGIVHCFDMGGELVWKKDLQQEYGQFMIQFGMTSSPILDNGHLYFQLIHGSMRDRSTSTGWIVALDAKTGDEIWKHKRETDAVAENKHSYASPVVYRDKDREFLVTHGGDFVIGHSLKDGSELWRCGGINPKGSGYNPFLRFVSSPVAVDGLIVVPSAKRGPVLGLDPASLKGDMTGNDRALKWRMDQGTPDVASPVVAAGLMYLAGERGTVTCVDAATGTKIYENRLMKDRHRSTPVVADGKVYLAERNGTMTVLEAGKEFKVLSKSELGEETTASPAVSNGRVYVRTFDALYSFGSK